MIPYARKELEAPVLRIAQRMDGAIAELSAHSGSPLWKQAIASVLAISRAPKHMLRSQLVLLGSLAGGGPAGGEPLERLSVGLELLHLFMLVHDDVMDNASLRRGRPTLRIALREADPTLTWGQARDLAILVGNVLQVLSVRHLSAGEAQATGATELVLDACFRTGAGQFQDVLGWRGVESDEEAFRRALVDKAAYHLFAAPMAAGLRLAAPKVDPEPAIAWGCRMGMAFQGVDDLTDLVGSPEVTGKDGFQDILGGRLSLALFLLNQRCSAEDQAFLRAVCGKGALDYADRIAVGGLVARHDVVGACAAYIRAEIAEARRIKERSGFASAAREGMSAIEDGLDRHLATIATQLDFEE